MPAIRGRARNARLGALMFLAAPALAGCGGDGPTIPGAPVDARIAATWGDGQAVDAGTVLPQVLALRVTDGGGSAVPNARIRWRVVAGAGELLSGGVVLRTPEQQRSITNVEGMTWIHFRPTAVGTSTVTATIEGLTASATFIATAIEPADVVIHFGPWFDCGLAGEPSSFAGPDGSGDVTASVGATVEWVYADWLHPSCTARVVSTAVPPGGEAFDSGVLGVGQRFRFVPKVTGTWEFADAVSGGTGTLTVW